MNDPAAPANESQNRLARLFRLWWRRHMRDLDRDATREQVFQDGGLSYSYVFLVVASCGIATLGLMLNSAAVIIGAMLVAPLMGPIVLLGFSIAETKVRHAVRSAKALAVGVAGALLISVAIVKLSPYIPPTPEILARTNPNLFDLLVAILSGMVAGYAVTKRSVGAVAGVAIATALMPPLAASGYGLATGASEIFQGAFFLFLTNMLAIAFSVAGMALWYGFGNLRTPRELLGQTVIAAAVLAVLSIPLVDTLNESVFRTLTFKQVEDTLRRQLDVEGTNLDKLTVDRTDDGLLVNAVVFTRDFDEDAQTRLQPMLAKQLDTPVKLQLDQIVVGDSIQKAVAARSVIANPVAVAPKQPPALSDAQIIVRQIKEGFPLPLTASEIHTGNKTAVISVAPRYQGDLRTLHQMERTLQSRFPEWKIHVVPPVRELPTLLFPKGSAEPDAEGLAVLATIEWALRRWEVVQVDVTGSAALREKGRATGKLANERAENVAQRLGQAGFTVLTLEIYPVPSQRTEEQEQGQAAFRRVQIRPRFTEVPASDHSPTLTDQGAPQGPGGTPDSN